jgi:N-acetylmuramoyl-L-alanine amidase
MNREKIMRKILLFLIISLICLFFCGCLNNEIKEDKSTVLEETEMATTETEIDKTESTTASQEEKIEKHFLVAIDAGHQKHQNSDLEAIGPGASEKKMKVTSGTEGIQTGTPEYVITLQVSKLLQQELENRGYDVLMIRKEDDVDISNRERAEMANDGNADVFLRIHCNSVDDSSTNGAMTLCPDRNNPYCDSDMITKSERLSELVLDGLCVKTGAKKLSITKTSTMSGINWSKVPVSIVEMGFMSNPQEDEKLNDHDYQALLAQGIADGVDKYFKRSE